MITEAEVTEDEKCSFCGKDNFEETFECADCGEFFPESERCFNEEVDDGFLCEECDSTRKNALSAKEEHELSEFILGWESYNS